MAEPRRLQLHILASFLIVVIGVGLAIGLAIQPGAWYAALNKPSFNPPNWIFGPAWTVLYVLIAIAGWWIWRHEGHSSRSMRIWVGQLLLNWIWTPRAWSVMLHPDCRDKSGTSISSSTPPVR